MTIADFRAHLRSLFVPAGSGDGAFPRFDLLVMAFAAAGALILVALDFFQRFIRKDVVEMLDIDGQRNPTTWFHASILGGAAICAAALAFTFFDARRRSQWLALAAGLAFFSLDKSISLHEQAGRTLADAFSLPDESGRIAWQAVWAPIILATAALLVVCVSQANRTAKLWALGMLTGGGAKLAVEAMMFPLIHWGGVSEHGTVYGFEVEIEESVQLLAFACLFAGFAQLLVDRLFALARVDVVAREPLPEAAGAGITPIPAPPPAAASGRGLGST
jgi:hypothetical protein